MRHSEKPYGHSRPKMGRRQLFAAAFLALIGVAAAAYPQPIQRQGGGDVLEIPRVLPQQPAAPPPAPANGSMLVIPRVSHDFAGVWGGHLRLMRVLGEARAMPYAVVSLVFGVRGGEVFIRTTAFAQPSSRILGVRVNVKNPRTVTIRLEGLEYDLTPPLRHVEDLHLVLTANKMIDCLKYVDFYESGRKAPIVSIAYRGTLHILTEAEERELHREVIRQGQVPQREVQGSRRLAR